MQILSKVVLITMIISGLIFSRTGKDDKREECKNLKVKNQYYWVKDHADDKGQLDRKRSHKRRRKIRKPIKGLR